MAMTKNLHVLEAGSFKALELPYDGKDVVMYIILPVEATKQSLDQICQKQFLIQFLTSRINAMEMQNVNVTLPKFKFNNNYELVPILQSMGLTDIFDILKADLGKMTTDG
jgi:serine protease inhibitor